MEPTSFDSGGAQVPPPDLAASRRISAEQMAAVNRLQAYWMARVGMRAHAVPEQPLDSDFGDVPAHDDHDAS